MELASRPRSLFSSISTSVARLPAPPWRRRPGRAGTNSTRRPCRLPIPSASNLPRSTAARSRCKWCSPSGSDRRRPCWTGAWSRHAPKRTCRQTRAEPWLSNRVAQGDWKVGCSSVVGGLHWLRRRCCFRSKTKTRAQPSHASSPPVPTAPSSPTSSCPASIWPPCARTASYPTRPTRPWGRTRPCARPTTSNATTTIPSMWWSPPASREKKSAALWSTVRSSKSCRAPPRTRWPCCRIWPAWRGSRSGRARSSSAARRRGTRASTWAAWRSRRPTTSAACAASCRSPWWTASTSTRATSLCSTGEARAAWST